MSNVDLESPSWRAAGATLVSYLLVLAVVTVLLFVVPYLVVHFWL